ncbi:nucleoid-associated protein [Leptospira santarosai]|uniref:Nucleoid-associated protein NdpA n=1 Tax=Leptospira santarosai serovar Shermani str. LT 821 TaxID=758847 RepID=K8XWQ3_9LEPT|nr:nucleoid-associated protein [Leptospira santarosai]EKS08889.1 nucleoid-associated protein NdpA [Leptospira santarosai str. JET]EKT85799.2 hypothetical protein LSS_15796 [Leptospira santarosai serovar Shermani str. LT 821]EPG81612.1 nucleoid-associated protein NdpA [Leptospira santarosai serovar Shermani str. 1342KT]MDI7226676.1 nucleoid-associated protein [Leptospira santarosai]MDI7230121.1 nucleoid-associated protein [Leptospira santarosai]
MLIDKVILHWVPKSDSTKPLTLSDNFADEVDRTFWQKKIEKSFEKKGCYMIEFIGSTPGTLGTLIRGLKASMNASKYIEISRQVAELLFREQNKHNISDGFLIIIKGKTDEEKEYICLLKLEGIEGSEAKFNSDRKSYDLKHLESILLTQKTKVFKMAYFILDGHSFMKIYAMDDQINGENIASFWLKNFLGCKLLDTPENLTKKVFEFVKDFSMSRRLKPEEGIDLRTALYSEFKSNRKTIKLSRMAKNHVPPDLLEYFNNKASKEQIPLYEFEKKFSPSISKYLSYRQFFLEEDIFVKIPSAVIDEQNLVYIRNTKDGRILEVKARIMKEK